MEDGHEINPQQNTTTLPEEAISSFKQLCIKHGISVPESEYEIEALNWLELFALINKPLPKQTKE